MDLSVNINSLSVKKQYWKDLGVNFSTKWSGFSASDCLEMLKVVRESFDHIRISYCDHTQPQYATDNKLTAYFTYNWWGSGDPFALWKQTGEYRPVWDSIKATEYKIFGV